LTQTIVEFPVGGFYDEKGVIDVRPGVMFALVPAMGGPLWTSPFRGGIIKIID